MRAVMTTHVIDVRDSSTAVGKELLTAARELAMPAVREWVEQLPPAARDWAGYHFGWLDDQGRPDSAPAGKAVRPALVFAACRAAGGAAEQAIAGAVAVELIHNFSLLHDDIMDGDHERRHRRTVWSLYGVPAGILAGVSLQALAFEVLSDTSGPAAASGCEILADALQALVEGQAKDLAYAERSDIRVADYLGMAAGKTGSLLGAACALGALAAVETEQPWRVERMRGFGRRLGIAFQVMDDVLGIFGDSKVTGKPVGADVATRKKSLPVLAALASDTAAGRELREMYERPAEFTPDEITRATELIESAGGRETARSIIRHQNDRAFAHLRAANPEPAAAAELTQLAHLLTHRES